MEVRVLLRWWILTIVTLLAYAGVDTALNPEQSRVRLEDLSFTWNASEPFGFIHVGARLVGALGWPLIIQLTIFGSGLVVIVAALFAKDE